MSNAYCSVIEPRSARRQFRLSVGLMLCIAIGAVILGFATQTHQPQKAIIVDDGGAFTGRLVSLN